MAVGTTFGQLVRKYGAVIFFPTVAVTSIYADWSHTRAWKQQLQAAQAKREASLHQ